MGFKRKQKQFLLKFADDNEGLAGFECLVGSLSIGDFLEFTETIAKAGVGGQAGAAATRTVLATLIGSTVSWNLEDDDDKPVPVVLARCTTSGQDIPESGRCAEHAEAEARCPVTGLLGYDIEFAMSLSTAWMQGMSGVTAPLGSGSPSGSPSLEGSIPMEPS